MGARLRITNRLGQLVSLGLQDRSGVLQPVDLLPHGVLDVDARLVTPYIRGLAGRGYVELSYLDWVGVQIGAPAGIGLAALEITEELRVRIGAPAGIGLAAPAPTVGIGVQIGAPAAGIGLDAPEPTVVIPAGDAALCPFLDYQVAAFSAITFSAVSMTWRSRFSIGWPSGSRGAVTTAWSRYLLSSLSFGGNSQLYVSLDCAVGGVVSLSAWYRRGSSSTRLAKWLMPADSLAHEYGLAFAGSLAETFLIDGVAQTPTSTAGSVGVPGYTQPIGVLRMAYGDTTPTTENNADHILVSDLRIWNRRLLDAELISQAHGNAYVYTSDMFGAWRFTEQSGVTAADSSGKGRNLTFTNAHVWPSGFTRLAKWCRYQDTGTDYQSVFPAGINKRGIGRCCHPRNSGKIVFEVRPVSAANGLRFGIVNHRHPSYNAVSSFPGNPVSPYLTGAFIIEQQPGGGASRAGYCLSGMTSMSWSDFSVPGGYGTVWVVMLDFTGPDGVMHLRCNAGANEDLVIRSEFAAIPLTEAWYAVVGQYNNPDTVGHVVDVNFGQEAWWADAYHIPGYTGWRRVAGI